MCVWGALAICLVVSGLGLAVALSPHTKGWPTPVPEFPNHFDDKPWQSFLLSFFFFFDERPAKPKVQPKDACQKQHKKIKAQHSSTQGMQEEGRDTEGALMAKEDPWQDVFSAQLENNLGTQPASATNC